MLLRLLCVSLTCGIRPTPLHASSRRESTGTSSSTVDLSGWRRSHRDQACRRPLTLCIERPDSPSFQATAGLSVQSQVSSFPQGDPLRQSVRRHSAIERDLQKTAAYPPLAVLSPKPFFPWRVGRDTIWDGGPLPSRPGSPSFANGVLLWCFSADAFPLL